MATSDIGFWRPVSTLASLMGMGRGSAQLDTRTQLMRSGDEALVVMTAIPFCSSMEYPQHYRAQNHGQ